MKLSALSNLFAVCRLSSTAHFPSWIDRKYFWAVTKTDEELSLVCIQSCVPKEVKAETGWRIIKVEGPLDFGMTGILASIAAPLATAKISIFALSTFDTDYILVKDENIGIAQKVLSNAGFDFQF